MIRHKKLIASILALTFLFGGLLMMMNKAEAGPTAVKGYTVKLTNVKYKVVFFTTNYKIYAYLKELGYKVVFKGELPKPEQPEQPAPAPQPQPQPQPVPKPEQPAPAPVAGLTADEAKMLELVNQERAKAGVNPLKVDMGLVKSARVKSQDMVNRNYFAHTAPDGTTPWDLMKAQCVTYSYAGENLAGAPTVERAHTALMNSDGHRRNILNPNFTHIGIGTVKGGTYGMMFTQHFATLR